MVELNKLFDQKQVLTNIIPTNKSLNYNNLKQVVETYTNEGYSCMTYDNIRNKAYKLAIEFQIDHNNDIEEKKILQVTEIGPGADGCLVKMVLNCKKKVIYFGLEGNNKSSKKCLNTLKQLQNDLHSYKIMNILSNNQCFQLTKIYRDTDILLHELIGYIASREGMITILYDICKRNFNKLPLTIPQIITTLFTPTFINQTTFKKTLRSFAKGVMRVNQYPNILLMQPFDFFDAKNAPFFPQCSTLEFWNCIKDSFIDKFQKQSFHTIFKASNDISINSLTGFIWVGFNKQFKSSSLSDQKKYPILNSQPEIEMLLKTKTNFFTTCNALPPFSSGWPNVILLLEKEIKMKAGNELHISSSSIFDTDIPIYEWKINHMLSDGTIISQEIILFS